MVVYARVRAGTAPPGDRAVARPVGSPVVVAPGRVASFVVHLRRGSYLLVDNLPWHYWKGTQAAFAVR
jgi:uncharacterized cupredoxin-like copper-binding protein